MLIVGRSGEVDTVLGAAATSCNGRTHPGCRVARSDNGRSDTTSTRPARRPGRHEPSTRTKRLSSRLGGIGTGLDPRSSRRLIEVTRPGR